MWPLRVVSPAWSSYLKEFKKIFRLAFPERPEDKLELLTMKVANVEKTDGKIRELPDFHLNHLIRNKEKSVDEMRENDPVKEAIK